MRFLILGPLEVYDGERRLSLGGARQRSLLAMLLLNVGEVVSRDRLIDSLWDEARREEGTKALSVAVSRLRKVLEPERPSGQDATLLVTRAPGYALVIDPEQIDLKRFERFVSAAQRTQPSAAAALLREALALWRGPPLADFAYESFAQPEIARLEEARMGALEQRIDADLALGRHPQVVGELERLVAEHPRRERLRGQLMLALYRSGRQAESLEAYRAGRELLVDQLGIEPGRELRELHEAILRQDSELEPGTPDAEERRTGVFVGRSPELAELSDGLEDAFAGRGRLFLVEGEPGIGKSRLAEELVARARAKEARVLIGRCWEAGDAPAYWPWTQALRTYAREVDTDALAAQLGAGAAEIAQFVPELRDGFPGLPAPSPVEPEGARFRLFEAVTSFIHNAAEQRPLVLVLDDLHAADEPSILLLRFVARELSSTRGLVLAAYRNVDPVLQRPLTEMVDDVTREPVTRRLELSGLSESEVAEYVQLSAPEIDSGEAAGALYGRTEGNPLFVGEIVRLLSLETAEPVEVPRSVGHVIARRLAHLSDEARRALLLASVLGREFSFDVLVRLASMDDEQLLAALEEAIEARVVSEVSGSSGRFRFEHVLIRDTLYDGLTNVRRVRLHEQVVAAFEQLDREQLGYHPGEMAQHSIAAHDPDKGRHYALLAAERALERHAYQEAARLFAVALEALEQRPPEDPRRRVELLLPAGDALVKAGSMDEAKRTFLDACDLARAERMPEAFASAALGYSGGPGWARAGVDVRLVPLLEEALSALGRERSALRARLLARLAGALRDQPSLEPRSSLAREAVGIARELEDADTLVYALTSLFMAVWGPAVGELVEITDEVSGLAAESGSSDSLLDALTLQGVVAWLTAADAAAEADDAYNALAEGIGESAAQWQGAMQDGLWALHRGDFAGAEELAARALRSGGARSADADCSYTMAMFVIRRAQGRLAEVEDLVRDAADRYPGYRSFRCFIPVVDHALGRADQARLGYEALARADFGALPRDSEWLFCLALLAELADRFHDRERAALLYEMLQPYPTVTAMAAGEVSVGPVARYLGILATTTAQWEAAQRHFEEAIAMSERTGGRPLHALTQGDYARMLVARGRAGDVERAGELRAATEAACRELGMQVPDTLVAANTRKDSP